MHLKKIIYLRNFVTAIILSNDLYIIKTYLVDS